MIKPRVDKTRRNANFNQNMSDEFVVKKLDFDKETRCHQYSLTLR